MLSKIDAIRQLYDAHRYPPMSHPTADPAATAASALLTGLRTPPPSQSRILEIGCASGHHLIPLALRWPSSHCTGIDLSHTAIEAARRRATSSGATNTTFHAADLRDWTADAGSYDFIIAHGFFSWVPDEIKTVLFSVCRRLLSPSGIAVISFNLNSGWSARLPIIEATRAIQAIQGGDLITALKTLRSAAGSASPVSAATAAIIDDMIGKGPAMLPFDDFAPVNDPWPLDRFLEMSVRHGLRWLGESDPAENLPSSLGASQRSALSTLANRPLALQIAADLVAARTFRSALLCRDDAPISPVSTRVAFDLCFRNDMSSKRPERPKIDGCLPASDLFPPPHSPELADTLYDAILDGSLRPRIEPFPLSREIPERPTLSSFRLLCAQESLPIVDAWHSPCGFPANHGQILRLMDGSRDIGQLATLSSKMCPELDFHPWLRHLAERGFFHPHFAS